MQFVCDAPNGKAWFRIETEGEAVHESRLMSHAVEKYFRCEREKAVQSWRPERPNAIERDIGLEAHVQREMPLFLTLRDREGNALATAMLPPGGKDRGGFRIIIVAASNADPYPEQEAAIAALGVRVELARSHIFDHTLTQRADSVSLAHGELHSELRFTAPRFSGRGSPALLLSSQLAMGLSALAPAQRAGAQRLCALGPSRQV